MLKWPRRFRFLKYADLGVLANVVRRDLEQNARYSPEPHHDWLPRDPRIHGEDMVCRLCGYAMPVERFKFIYLNGGWIALNRLKCRSRSDVLPTDGAEVAPCA